MAIYKRGHEKYEVRLYGWEAPGKPKAWTVHGTRKEAEAFEAGKRLELAGRGGPTQSRTAPRFSEFSLGRYADHAKVRLGAKTWQNRRCQLATLVEFFGRKQLNRISADDVEEFQDARLKSVGAAKVNDDVKVLKRVLNYAIKVGVPAAVPNIARLTEPKRKGRVTVWTAEQVNALYESIGKECPHLMVAAVLMVNAGLRKGEAIALEWTAVDLTRGHLLIYPNEEWTPKDNEPREIPIGDALMPWLSVPKRERKHARWVVTGVEGEGYATWPQRQFDRARKAARVDGVPIGGSPHVCRHTYASHFLASTPDLYLLSRVLGHSHTRVTELYSHLLPDHLARARNAVNLPVPIKGLRTTVSGHGSDTGLGSRRGRRGR